MATYQYRCPTCGLFERVWAMGTAGPVDDCPRCGRSAPRSYTVPHVTTTPAPLARALSAAEKSRDEPETVRRPAARPQVDASQVRAPNGRALPRW